VVALLAALAGGVAGGLVVNVAKDDSSPAPTGAMATTAPGTVNVVLTSAVSDAAAKGRPSVIRIESTRRTALGVEQDIGSGIVLDREGHVLTNAHVVLGTETLKAVFPDGSEQPAILIGHDFPFTDIAVLQVGPGSNLVPAEIGDSALLALGETVLAIGNPLAEFDGSVTVGVVSGVARRRVFDAVLQEDIIQTDAAVNNGNSGGALLNLRGQVVGVPTAIIRQFRGGQQVEGIAFALPINRAMAVARGIIAALGNYPRPAMGLEHADLGLDGSPRPGGRLAVDQGALVTAVTPGGPAATAGIGSGDVITRLGDLDVTRDRPLLNALMAYHAGDTVRVVLNRNGRIIEAEVRLAKKV
jgi:2-alkenal reductase